MCPWSYFCQCTPSCHINSIVNVFFVTIVISFLNVMQIQEDEIELLNKEIKDCRIEQLKVEAKLLETVSVNYIATCSS